MKKVAIGSHNPVKINATQKAFLLVWPRKKFEYIPISAPSQVSEQPMSDEECIRGAINRAQTARRQARADFGVGLEGGICKLGHAHFVRAWIAVIDRQKTIGLGSTVSAPLPRPFIQLMRTGIDLGKATDLLTGQTNTKHKQGYFGLASSNIITREQGYTDGVIMALSRFRNPKLFR